MPERFHTIKAVAHRTGLSQHVIRVWERRYQAVTPTRTGTNRRLYSEDEVSRLELLRDATHAGHGIGRIAQLPVEKLRGLAGPAKSAGAQGPGAVAGKGSAAAADFFEHSISAIKELDQHRLDAVLSRAAVVLGQTGLLQQVIAPLTQRVGDLWREGEIKVAHEHMASAVIRTVLSYSSKPFAGNLNAPGLVVATPAGQLHEIGAAMVAAAATHQGWRVTYLGSSLPATEIAGAAVQNGARAVALSIVYPEDDPHLAEELQNLRRFLGNEVQIFVGGRASAAYQTTLAQIGAIRCADLHQLYAALDNARVAARSR